MKEEFAIILQKHRMLGWLLMPYTIISKEDFDFKTVKEFISLGQINKTHSDLQKKIVTLVAEYDEKNLTLLFSKKKKLTQKEFIDSLPEDLLTEHIRPFIEKRIAKCIDIILKEGYQVYLKKDKSNLYPEDLIEITDHSPETVFNFKKDEEGLQYHLTVLVNETETNLLNKSHILLSNSPCRIIIDQKLYCFDDINGNKLLPFFNKATIKVPEKFEEQYFKTFIFNSIIDYKVNAVGFSVETHTADPLISLSITSNIKQQPVLFPEFVYNTKRMHVNTTDKTIVDIIKTDNSYSYIKYIRNIDFENSVISKFHSLGLKKYDEVFMIPKENFSNDSELYSNILTWIRNNNDFLRESGIFIKNLDDKEIYTGTVSLNMDISKFDDDWFDIHAIVKFGEFEIPFKRLRKNIIENKRILKLPNDQIAIIPEEWFSQYRDMFLFNHDNEGSESIRLSKVHFQVIENQITEKEQTNNKTQKQLQFFEEEDITVPVSINANLRSYQKTGFNWLYFLMRNNLGGCLADDMGLGKTLQTLTLIQKAIDEYQTNEPDAIVRQKEPKGQLSLFDLSEQSNKGTQPATLIVMPASLIHNWYNETQKFTPNLKVYKYIGNDRDKELNYFDNYDIILTTYGLLRNDIECFVNYKFFYIILDESQVIKNPTSKIYNSVLLLKSHHKLVLTGTPIENSLIDLWAQINFLNRDMLGSINFFKEEFVKQIENKDESTTRRLKKLLKPFILRREKQEVAKDLPDLTELVQVCKMNDDQAKFYESEKSKVRNLIYESIEKNGLNKSSIFILQALTKLRQIANHPTMVEDGQDMTSGKFDEIIRIITDLQEEKKHKILIFSSFVKHLEIFGSYFTDNQIKYTLLTGETRDREGAVNKFQEDEDTKIFLISIKAGGVGLNLTAADYVFILDPWWNPAIENQAVSRAHRIGQKNKVFVYRFISENTIEEKIKLLQERKKELAQVFVNSENNIDFSEDIVEYLFE